MSLDELYINAGVLLLNLKRMREEHTADSCHRPPHSRPAK